MALLILSNRSKTDIESFSKNVAGMLVWAYLVRYASAIADLQETGVQPSYMSEVCKMEVELKAKDFFGYDTWATGTRGYLESMAKTLANDVIRAQ